jgi:hypothetical protein
MRYATTTAASVRPRIIAAVAFTSGEAPNLSCEKM